MNYNYSNMGFDKVNQSASCQSSLHWHSVKYRFNQIQNLLCLSVAWRTWFFVTAAILKTL